MDSQAGPSASANAEARISTSAQQQGERERAPPLFPTTSSPTAQVLPPTATEWAIEIEIPEGMSEAECISRKNFMTLPYDIHVEFAKSFDLPDADILTSEEICDALCSENRWIPPLLHHNKIPAPDGEGIIVTNDLMVYFNWKVEQAKNEIRSAKLILPDPDDVYSSVRREGEREDQSAGEGEEQNHSSEDDDESSKDEDDHRKDESNTSEDKDDSGEDEDNSGLRSGEVKLRLPVPQAGETSVISPIARARGMPPPPFVYPPKGRSWSGEGDRKIVELIPPQWFDNMAEELEKSYEFLKAAVDESRVEAREARADVFDTMAFIEKEKKLQKEAKKKIAKIAGQKIVDRIEADISYASATGELPVRLPGEDEDEFDSRVTQDDQTTEDRTFWRNVNLEDIDIDELSREDLQSFRCEATRRQRETRFRINPIRRNGLMSTSTPRKSFHIVGTPPKGFKYPIPPISYSLSKDGPPIDLETYRLALNQRSALRNNFTRSPSPPDATEVWNEEELQAMIESQELSASNGGQSSSTSASDEPVPLPQANVNLATSSVPRVHPPVRASVGPDIFHTSANTDRHTPPPPPPLFDPYRTQGHPEAAQEEDRGRRANRAPAHNRTPLRSALRKTDGNRSSSNGREPLRVRFTAESINLKRSRSVYEEDEVETEEEEQGEQAQRDSDDGPRYRRSMPPSRSSSRSSGFADPSHSHRSEHRPAKRSRMMSSDLTESRQRAMRGRGRNPIHRELAVYSFSQATPRASTGRQTRSNQSQGGHRQRHGHENHADHEDTESDSSNRGDENATHEDTSKSLWSWCNIA